MSKGIRFTLLMLAAAVLICAAGCGGGSAEDKGPGWFAGLLGFVAGLFVFGTLPFWLLIIGSVISIAAAIEREIPRSSWATVFTVVTLALIWWCNPGIGTWVRSHGPIGYVCVSALVVLIGVIWMIMRWKLWTLKCERYYQEVKRNWLDSKKIGPEVQVVPENLKREWAEYIESQNGLYSTKKIYPNAPHPSQHMARIAAWGIYWPWSMAGYFLGPLLKELYAILARRLQALLLKLSLQSYRGVDADFAPHSRPRNPSAA